MFLQSDRIGNDLTDQTQNNIQNTNYLNRVLQPFQSSNHVDFATQYPGLMTQANARGGLGLGESEIHQESLLFWNQQERPLEKVQLFPRPFLTIPYLGKGSCDPVIESKLMMGEMVRGKKSVSTVMEDNFSDLDQYPLEKKPSPSIEELAMDGWVRGGLASRESGEKYFSTKSRPSWGD